MAAQADNKELTIQEKNDVVKKFCEENATDGCFCEDGTAACPLAIYKDPFCYDKITEEKVIRNYDTLLPYLEENDESAEEQAEHDAVNHPTHYTNGGMECLDEMVLVFGAEAVKHFCVCNVWKYRYRAMSKGGKEDLRKADFYMQKYKELTI
jgi:hypothetical protein